MSSLRNQEGYFLMDHSQSPGVPDSIIVAQGLEAGAGKRLYESATFTCSHCERIVVMRQDRKRERGYCKKCDHLICDTCETVRVQTGKCYPFKAMIEDIRNGIAKGRDPTEVINSVLLLP